VVQTAPRAANACVVPAVACDCVCDCVFLGRWNVASRTGGLDRRDVDVDGVVAVAETVPAASRESLLLLLLSRVTAFRFAFALDKAERGAL
jgi:hypothetical protein